MEILGGILWFLLEAFGDLLLEIVLELGLAALKELLGWEELHPFVATAGYVVLGGALGGVSVWLLPHRLLRPFPIPGMSLLLTPAVAGWAMQLWGNYRRGHGHSTTSLATWYGGGGFAFGVAIVRYIAIL